MAEAQSKREHTQARTRLAINPSNLAHSSSYLRRITITAQALQSLAQSPRYLQRIAFMAGYTDAPAPCRECAANAHLATIARLHDSTQDAAVAGSENLTAIRTHIKQWYDDNLRQHTLFDLILKSTEKARAAAEKARDQAYNAEARAKMAEAEAKVSEARCLALHARLFDHGREDASPRKRIRGKSIPMPEE